jgi:hypothetical protein
MSIQRVIEAAIQRTTGDTIGTIASPPYQVDDGQGGWTWAVDVDLGEEQNGETKVLTGVPIATNNRDVYYAEIGKPVALRKENTRWVVVGLSKTVKSASHLMYVCFEDDIATIVSDRMVGVTIRFLTYGELAAYGGYGNVPYGARAKFDYDGNFIEFV